MIFVRGILAWFVIMALMFVNGAVRKLITAPLVGVGAADIAHVVIGCLIILWLACLFCRRERAACPSRLAILGVVWLLMTLAFETILTIWVRGRPLRELTDAYDITRGELWPVVVATVLFAPLCAGLLCGPRSRVPEARSTADQTTAQEPHT